MTASINTFCIKCHYAECHYAECHYAECHYAECHYAECRNLFIVVIMLNVNMPSVVAPIIVIFREANVKYSYRKCFKLEQLNDDINYSLSFVSILTLFNIYHFY